MHISLKHIPIHPILKGYVEKLWVFEASGRVPSTDMKLIVPNGMVKLVIPFKNGLEGQREGYSRLSKNNQMTLIGVSDTPFIVDAQHDEPAGTIGIEFSPLGAYRFFNLKQSELKNHIFMIDEVFNRAVSEIQEQIANCPRVDDKIELLQKFLLKLFTHTAPDPIFEYCIQRIQETNGAISIKELEKSTGYSSRWLNMKFQEKIGVSPKNLCAISRFQFFYQTLISDPSQIFENKIYHSIYHDQSHFIKEFKRFTGMPPTLFERQTNDFGKIFYK